MDAAQNPGCFQAKRVYGEADMEPPECVIQDIQPSTIWYRKRPYHKTDHGKRTSHRVTKITESSKSLEILEVPY